MEELKRLYISLFQNAEEKAIAEIMFDEMTQEEKLQVFFFFSKNFFQFSSITNFQLVI